MFPFRDCSAILFYSKTQRSRGAEISFLEFERGLEKQPSTSVWRCSIGRLVILTIGRRVVGHSEKSVNVSIMAIAISHPP